MTSDDKVVLRAMANLWRGAESVGGRLTLTDRYLSFRAHALNLQTAPLDIPLSDIAGTRRYRNMGLVPNGLAVTTRSGTEYRFVVRKRDRWIDRIAELTS
ncbi:GRAM domain-containing protein [Micromonospora inositola]|uniref:GRAM domain-containing protein n=1 Tax=Micromonospora inositola TaxID=47865 RepID=A0A1C5K3Z5_9ACTN|nr:GRAM domain-containing protein [Micromonospora inositola]SCG77517.1 hypothetical protein GA0070613_6289 [Micromonospora inositola]